MGIMKGGCVRGWIAVGMVARSISSGFEEKNEKNMVIIGIGYGQWVWEQWICMQEVLRGMMEWFGLLCDGSMRKIGMRGRWSCKLQMVISLKMFPHSNNGMISVDDHGTHAAPLSLLLILKNGSLNLDSPSVTLCKDHRPAPKQVSASSVPRR